MLKTFDCVVIGAGVVGVSVVQQLARSGLDVALLDSAPDVGGGCSYANVGIVAPTHVGPLATPALLKEAPAQMLRTPPAVRIDPDPSLVPWLARLTASATPRRARIGTTRLRELAHKSADLHRQLAEHGLNPTFRKTGAMNVFLRPSKLPDGHLTPDRVRELEPAIGEMAGGLHEPDEWLMESRNYVRTMLDDAVAHGARASFGALVKGFTMEGGRITGVITDRGPIHTSHVIIAAGVASRTLAAHAGLNLPMRGGRGYIIDVDKPADGAPAMPMRIREHRVVITPMPDRIRVAGSIEFGDEHRPVDEARGKALLQVATSLLPALRGQRIQEIWAGERPCTADGLPAIGTSKRVPNLSVATGHGMWGMILAPVTAEILRDAIVHGTEAPVTRWLNPDRFSRS